MNISPRSMSNIEGGCKIPAKLPWLRWPKAEAGERRIAETPYRGENPQARKWQRMCSSLPFPTGGF
jgi:hypothetical protein